jgi:hypothetical protein
MGSSKNLINFGVIGYVIGGLILINGFLMALPLGFSLYLKDGVHGSFLTASGITFAVGLSLRYILRNFTLRFLRIYP